MIKKHYLILLSFLLPVVTSAHVKWFVDVDGTTEKYHDLTTFYSLTQKEVLIWSAIVLGTIFLFSLLDSFIKTPKKLLSFGLKNEKVINRVSQVILGLFLVTVSLIWKIILVPNIPVNSSVTIALQIIQIIIGLMFILNLKPRIASIVLLIFCIGIGLEKGIIEFLENAILVSLALYFFIINSKEDSKIFQIFNKHSIEIIRIGTGISLIVLAFTEKFLYPELSLQFLSVHHWNFMQSIFPWFTDKLFVLSTGFAEMIFGILFILGYVTRITTVLIALFFALSVVTMLVQFGQWEVEDLVVYSAAIIFIFFGHGKTKFFHFMWPNSKLHTSLLKSTDNS